MDGQDPLACASCGALPARGHRYCGSCGRPLEDLEGLEHAPADPPHVPDNAGFPFAPRADPTDAESRTVRLPQQEASGLIDDVNPPAQAKAAEERAPGALAAWLLAGLIIVGVLAPFVSSAGESGALRESGEAWFWFVPSGIAVVGAILASRRRSEGIGLAAGVGAFHIAFCLIVFVMIWLVSEINTAFGGSSIEPHIGALAWGAAMIVTVVLVVLSLRAVGRDKLEHRLVPSGVAWLAAIGAAVLAFGMVTPPSDGISVADHLFPGDGWVTAFNLYVIGLVPAAALLLLATRTRTALGLFAGASSWFVLIWWFTARNYRASGEEFMAFLNGGFAPTTVGIAAIAAAALLGFGMQPRSDGGTGMTLHPLTLLPLIGMAVLIAVGVAEHSERSDFGYDEYDDWSYTESEFDSDLADLADWCLGGDMDSCDALYWRSPSGSEFENVGATCGNREYGWTRAGTCAS